MVLFKVSAVLCLVIAQADASIVSPIHLQNAPRSHQGQIGRRSEVLGGIISTSGPLPLPLMQKQDNIFLTSAYGTPYMQNEVISAVISNQQAATDAILSGLDSPQWQEVAPIFRRQSSLPLNWDFTDNKIRGVNLGGWLVLEPWITPSIFDATGNSSVVDEWTYCEILGRGEAASRLSDHWSTFITENDIASIASNGLNHIRIPIGFWAFDVSGGEPYAQGQYPWLITAVGWAQNHGVNVIIDLHGAPGSQNGFDNSGRRGNILWNLDQSNINRTLAVIQILASEFSQSKYGKTVTAIQLLNEPAGFFSSALLQKYKESAYNGYGIVRYPSGSQASAITLSLHDAFQPLDSWQDSFPSPNFQGVSLDTHVYTIFSTDNIALSESDRIMKICNMTDYLARSNSDLWTMVGEWSPVPNDCASSLNGRGVGSRYDGSFPGSTAVGSCNGLTGSITMFTEEYKAFLRKFFEVQTSVYEQSTVGWIMWTWKTEAADEWSYSAGLAGGWIPSDPTEKVYGNQCG